MTVFKMLPMMYIFVISKHDINNINIHKISRVSYNFNNLRY